jgi:hypothetical protein
MGKEASVDVTGPTSAAALAKAVGQTFRLSIGEADPVDGHMTVGDLIVVRPNPGDLGEHEYIVSIYTGRDRADRDARTLFDRLAESTPWGLALLDDGFATIDERAASAQVPYMSEAGACGAQNEWPGGSHELRGRRWSVVERSGPETQP